MFKFYSELKYILKKKEINQLFLILFFLLLIVCLDALSFSLIIPIANIIFFEKTLSISFFKQNYPVFFNDNFFLLFFFVLIFFFKNFIIIFFNLYFTDFFKKINNRVSSSVFLHFLNLEYKFFLKDLPKEFFQKILADLNYANTFSISYIIFVSEIIFFFFISCVLIYVDYKIFFVVIFGFSFFLILYISIFKKRINYWAYQSRDSSSNLYNLTIEGFIGLKDIIIYDLKKDFNYKFDQNINVNNHANARILFLNNVQRYWLEIVGIIIIFLTLYYLMFFKIKVVELIPILGLFIFVIFRVLTSLNRIVLNFQNIKFYYPSFQAIAKECKNLANSEKNQSKIQLNFENYIEFSNVSFSYNNSKNILDKINLKIYKNKCVGIFGDNGSGKTTLLNLVAGLLQPSEGKIVIDSKYDLYSNREAWYKNISYVQQDIFLLDGSIEYNITLQNKLTHKKSQLTKLKKIINLEKYFCELPEGLETPVGRNGTNLSGGQKQMISIARALYKDSPILLFDEPTSAMDNINSTIIRNLLSELKGKKTIIIITHDQKLFDENYFDEKFKIREGKIDFN
jgi:ABC-type bacteriocin/lantibiotic exporter with double-glycine peptidase domain